MFAWRFRLAPVMSAALAALSGGPELALRIPSKKSEGNPEPGDVALGPEEKGWKIHGTCASCSAETWINE